MNPYSMVRSMIYIELSEDQSTPFLGGLGQNRRGVEKMVDD